MYRELEKEGLPVAEFRQQDFMFYATVQNKRVVSNEKGLIGVKKESFNNKKELFDKVNNSLNRGDLTLIMHNHIVKILE